MELETRYAVLLTGLKPHEPAGFINELIERIANTQHFAAQDVGFKPDFKATLNSYLTAHRGFRFFLRPHGSAQAHLKDVAWSLEENFEDTGKIPCSHQACAAFDVRVNRILRSVGKGYQYFVPAEEMLLQWLADYVLPACSEEDIEHARQELKRQMRENARSQGRECQ